MKLANASGWGCCRSRRGERRLGRVLLVGQSETGVTVPASSRPSRSSRRPSPAHSTTSKLYGRPSTGGRVHRGRRHPGRSPPRRTRGSTPAHVAGRQRSPTPVRNWWPVLASGSLGVDDRATRCVTAPPIATIRSNPRMPARQGRPRGAARGRLWLSKRRASPRRSPRRWRSA